MATESGKLLRWAEQGDLESLLNYIADETEDEYERDAMVYQWLCVASDFGCQEAGDFADDMFESSSLRYDDGQLLTGQIHLELGRWYLLGEESLPEDSEKGFAHLEQANEFGVRESVQIEDQLDALRARLKGDELTAFEKLFPIRR